MRRLPLAAALLAATLCGSGTALGADARWDLVLGGGPAYLSSASGFTEASGLCVSAVRTVRPWLFVGGAADWNSFTPEGLVTIPEIRTSVGHTRVTALSAVVRVQPDVHAGPAPFAILEAGCARVHFGDVRFDGSGFGYASGVTPGAVEWGARMAAGAGLRLVVPGGWPDLEASARAVTLGLRERLNFTELRAALSY